MSDTVKLTAMLCLLIPLAVEDVRRQKLNMVWILFWGCAGIVGNCFWGQESWLERLVSWIPGMILLLSGILGKGVGLGDAFLFLAIGGIGTASFTFHLLVNSLCCCACAGLILRVTGKKSWKAKLPFVPFVLLAYLADVIISAVV